MEIALSDNGCKLPFFTDMTFYITADAEMD